MILAMIAAVALSAASLDEIKKSAAQLGSLVKTQCMMKHEENCKVLRCKKLTFALVSTLSNDTDTKQDIVTSAYDDVFSVCMDAAGGHKK